MDSKTYKISPDSYQCIRAAYDWTVSGNGPMHGEWDGWRVAGQDLISPWGQRVSRAMVERFLMEARLRGAKLSSRGVKGPSAPSVTRTRGSAGASNVVTLNPSTESAP